MILVYLDESGNTGNNLSDPLQPIFVLCAMLVPEDKWLELEKGLQAVVAHYFPTPHSGDFEVHAADLRTGKGAFHGMSVGDRIAFRDAWMDVAANQVIKLIYRAIEKRRYQQWLQDTFGG